jgi:hypothetical protein
LLSGGQDMASAMAKIREVLLVREKQTGGDDEITLWLTKSRHQRWILGFFTVPLRGRAPSTWRSHEEIGRP